MDIVGLPTSFYLKNKIECPCIIISNRYDIFQPLSLLFSLCQIWNLATGLIYQLQLNGARNLATQRNYSGETVEESEPQLASVPRPLPTPENLYTNLNPVSYDHISSPSPNHSQIHFLTKLLVLHVLPPSVQLTQRCICRSRVTVPFPSHFPWCQKFALCLHHSQPEHKRIAHYPGSHPRGLRSRWDRDFFLN